MWSLGDVAEYWAVESQVFGKSKNKWAQLAALDESAWKGKYRLAWPKRSTGQKYAAQRLQGRVSGRQLSRDLAAGAPGVGPRFVVRRVKQIRLNETGPAKSTLTRARRKRR
jgi:hypothetical protein